VAAPARHHPLRALPPCAYVPGRSARPPAIAPSDARDAALPQPSYLPDERWLDNAEYLWGVDLYNQGFFWEAHEAWEGLWRAAEHDELQRLFLQGLIQCAAACLKAAIGDADACLRLSARGLARLERVNAGHGARYMGLDVPSFMLDFQRFANECPAAVERRPWLELA
jgi:hypothetical protein